ncbi:MAG TPA: serine protease [Candidatus Dormibacteraeota bacterium]|nr:serine protease [Candidatus Dormibacteraeota bacterium]
MKALVFLLWLGAAVPGFATGATRFVVDDDAYAAQVSQAGEKLLRAHKLFSLETLRAEVHTSGAALSLTPLWHEKLDAPDLCERLRESTFAVGSLYRCPDCGGWHFSGSSGFVINENGIICTCCHVLIEEDAQIKESYLVAADSAGHVFPVKSVVAADTDADCCLLKIEANGLKPLPLRTGARAGESVYCLSHPGGYYFMFTQGIISRLNRRTNADHAEHGHEAAAAGRAVVMLNITAEFAPGSSGAPVADTSGNVVGQVASIADAGEPAEEGETQAAAPSVPVRFCTATEELLRLMNPNLAKDSRGTAPLRPAKKNKVKKLSQRPVCPLAKPPEVQQFNDTPGVF